MILEQMENQKKKTLDLDRDYENGTSAGAGDDET